MEAAVADPNVKIATLENRSVVARPPLLTERIVSPIKAAAAKSFPGVPLVPLMAAGGTDAAFLIPAGIPTYGLTGFFFNAEGTHAHGVGERIPVKSLMEGRVFLHELVKLYASTP